jgi:hypothetical protein
MASHHALTVYGVEGIISREVANRGQWHVLVSRTPTYRWSTLQCPLEACSWLLPDNMMVALWVSKAGSEYPSESWVVTTNRLSVNSWVAPQRAAPQRWLAALLCQRGAVRWAAACWSVTLQAPCWEASSQAAECRTSTPESHRPQKVYFQIFSVSFTSFSWVECLIYDALDNENFLPVVEYRVWSIMSDLHYLICSIFTLRALLIPLGRVS